MALSRNILEACIHVVGLVIIVGIDWRRVCDYFKQFPHRLLCLSLHWWFRSVLLIAPFRLA